MASHTPATARTLHPGTVALGLGHQENGGDVYKLLFVCRKNGFDFLGQLKLEARTDTVSLEMFNAAYFSRFDADREEVLRVLELKVLSLLGRHEIVPTHFRELGQIRLRQLQGARPPEPNPPEPDEECRELPAIYDRLNQQYFGGRLNARIEWGRETRTINRRSFKFGSYDARKNLIRIHPRLKQEFVPRHVLELTVYHEMCHQAFPPVKRNGQWLAHHPDFKKKEREYRHFKEAMKWEKTHWAKLLTPVPPASS